MSITRSPNWIKKFRNNPVVRAMMAWNDFATAGSATMTLDMNSMRDDYRRIVVEDWCQIHATGRWRRRVVERRGYAVLDRIIVEFEQAADAITLRRWLKARGW